MFARRLLCAVSVFAIAGVFVCSAQVEQGTITGVIVDQTQAAVAKVKVTATNTATQAIARTETNDEGYYRIPYLTPGNYTVAADKTGFAPERVTDITLR